jgi:cytochrome c oxidase cbb3-type subunit 3/ubiquinol-cytochrome c reductase cytochrome c subunit
MPTPMLTRAPPILQAVLLWFGVLGACVASGNLECGGVMPTVQERRGEHVYARMCAVCHGPAGEGYAADQAPQLANQNFLASVSDEFLRAAITGGRTGTTMSAWARGRGGPLTSGDIDGLVAALHEWHERPRAVLDERPPTGDITRGAAAFTTRCVACHGIQGTGGPNLHIGNLDLLSTATNGFLRYAIREGRPGTAMVAYGSTLGDQGVEDVLALLRSWQARSTVVPRAEPARPPPLPLGPVPLNPKGPEPVGFRATPATTPADSIEGQLTHGARMAILDARAPSDYVNEHIAGAVSVPFYDPEPYVAQLPRDAWLVCYCACPHAESGTLAQKLAIKGFTKVTVLDEGLGVWKSRRYPTHTGIDP